MNFGSVDKTRGVAEPASSFSRESGVGAALPRKIRREDGSPFKFLRKSESGEPLNRRPGYQTPILEPWKIEF